MAPLLKIIENPAFEPRAAREFRLHSIECATIDDIEGMSEEQIARYIELRRRARAI